MMTDQMSSTSLPGTRECHADRFWLLSMIAYLTQIPSCDREMRKVLNCEVVRLHTKPIRGGGGNTQIIAAWISYKTVVPTMLFSHGNAVDLGQMLPFYRSSPFQGRQSSS